MNVRYLTSEEYICRLVELNVNVWEIKRKILEALFT